MKALVKIYLKPLLCEVLNYASIEGYEVIIVEINENLNVRNSAVSLDPYCRRHKVGGCCFKSSELR